MQEVTRAYMDKILDSTGETYEPRGLFLCSEVIGGVTVYTAMRNLNGEGLTEDFISHLVAVRWLHGIPTSEKSIYKPLTVDRISRILEEMNGESK